MFLGKKCLNLDMCTNLMQIKESFCISVMIFRICVHSSNVMYTKVPFWSLDSKSVTWNGNETLIIFVLKFHFHSLFVSNFVNLFHAFIKIFRTLPEYLRSPVGLISYFLATDCTARIQPDSCKEAWSNWLVELLG